MQRDKTIHGKTNIEVGQISDNMEVGTGFTAETQHEEEEKEGPTPNVTLFRDSVPFAVHRTPPSLQLMITV